MRHDPHHRFESLHHGASPLLLPNAWDAASARLWQEAGSPAVGTSSAAMAWSSGWPDGGALPPRELLGAVERMVRVLEVPLTVDIEAGYSDDPGTVAALVRSVAEAGAVGINIEDGTGTPQRLADKIRAIRDRLGTTGLFINARTDVLLRGLAKGDAALAEIASRLELYREAGADGGFVPGLTAAGDAARLAVAGPFALNLMVLPGLAPLDALTSAGIRRVSAGPGPFGAAFAAGRAAVAAMLAGDFGACTAHGLDYGVVDALFAAA